MEILPGRSCTGWESEACIQLTSLEDAHAKWKHYVAFKLLFLWYVRFAITQKIEPFTFLGNWDKMVISDQFLSGVSLHDFKKVLCVCNRETIGMETLIQEWLIDDTW